MFFTLSLGFGALISFASYMPMKNNCVRDAYTVVLINCGTSIFAGIVVFSILGHRQHVTGIPVTEVRFFISDNVFFLGSFSLWDYLRNVQDRDYLIGQNFGGQKFGGQKFSADKIFGRKSDFWQFCPSKCCLIRYTEAFFIIFVFKQSSNFFKASEWTHVIRNLVFLPGQKTTKETYSNL